MTPRSQGEFSLLDKLDAATKGKLGQVTLGELASGAIGQIKGVTPIRVGSIASGSSVASGGIPSVSQIQDSFSVSNALMDAGLPISSASISSLTSEDITPSGFAQFDIGDPIASGQVTFDLGEPIASGSVLEARSLTPDQLDNIIDARESGLTINYSRAWPTPADESEHHDEGEHHLVAAEVIDDVRDWMDRVSPKALSRMDGATEAYNAEGHDYEAQTALSCRRAMDALADFLCPPSEPKSDRDGRMHELDQPSYKNRLLRYLEQAKRPDGSHEIASDEIKLLAFRMDRLNDRLQKGVHDDATARETQGVLLYTWLAIYELSRVASTS